MADLYRAVARMRDDAGEYTIISPATPWRDSAERARADYATDAEEAWIETANWQREDAASPASPDRDFIAPAPVASVNGPRVPAPQGARAQLQHDTTDSMEDGPVGGSAAAVGHHDDPETVKRAAAAILSATRDAAGRGRHDG